MDFNSEWEDLLEVSQNGFLIPIPNVKLSDLSREILIIKNVSGDTMLHVAARRCSIEFLSRLVEFADGLNNRGDMGYTPLHYAAEANRKINYNFLLSAGSDPSLMDDFGDLPSDLFPEA